MKCHLYRSGNQRHCLWFI